MCSVFRSDCVDMLGRGPHGLGSRASLGSRTKKFCIPDRVIRKPNPPAADRRRAIDVWQSRTESTHDHRGSCVSLCQPLPYSRRPVHGCLG